MFHRCVSFTMAGKVLSFTLQLMLLILALFTIAQNFPATYGNAPAPIKIDVEPKFIGETRLKAFLTRYPTDIDQPDDLADGPPRQNTTAVRDYWVKC